MARIVEAEGKHYEFPDEATDDQIAATLKSQRAASWWGTIKSIPQTIVGAAERAVGGGLQKIGETDVEQEAENYAAERGGGQPQNLRALETPAEKKKRVAEVAESPIAKAGADIADLGKATIEEASPGQMSYWQRAVQNAAVSVATTGPAVAASVLLRNPAPALAVGSAQAGGSGYADSREAGADPERANVHAGIDAAAEAVFEYLPAKFLVDKAAGPVLKLIAGTMLREVPTEVLTTAVQSANARLRDAELKGQPWSWGEYGQDLLDTVGSTMIAAPVTAGIAKVAGMGQRQEEKSGSISPDYVPQQPPAAEPTPVAEPAPKIDQPTGNLTAEETQSIDEVIASISETLLDDKVVEEAKAKVAAYDKEKKKAIDPAAEVAWAGLSAAPSATIEDAGELGASPRSTKNASQYINPNTGDRLDRVFTYGPEDALGKTPREVQPGPGTYTLGVPSEDRGPEYLKALHDSVEQWRAQYMPHSTFVLSNEQLYTPTALGSYSRIGPNQHLIVPAVLRNPSKGLGSYNSNAQATAFYNLTHEFGHALTTDRFLEGMDELTSQALLSAAKQGVVGEDVLAKLPESQAAVVREFNALKSRIMSGEMKAQEFLDTWFGPAKLGRKTFLEKLGVAPTAPALDVGKALTRKAAEKASLDPKQAAVLQRFLMEDYFSLHEYLAEQTARHAYATGWDKTSPVGQFFAKALASLRNFFAGLKKEGLIAPGVAFTDWIEGLPKMERPMKAAETIVKAKEAVKAAPKAKKEKAPKVKAEPKVEQVQHNVETDTSPEKAKTARKLVTNLVREGVIDAQDANFKKLMQLIKENDFGTFMDEFQKMANKTVKFELDADLPEGLHAALPEEYVNDPAIRARAISEWQKKGFGSSFFKAWFGDWENDAANSSKIRENILLPDPATGHYIANTDEETGQLVIEAGSANPPLTVYHATRSSTRQPGLGFDTFQRGDLGFHFGTVRAAHIRMTYGALGQDTYLHEVHDYYEKDAELLTRDPNERNIFGTPIGPARQEGVYVIPAVLNIRNPLYIGSEENGGIWSGPQQMLAFLLAKEFISPYDFAEVTLQYSSAEIDYLDMYKSYEPVRELLLSKGYDGMIYQNNAEGDISFVTFRPEQVKSLLGTKTFSKSPQMHFELDYDRASPQGSAASNLMRNLKNFLLDPGPLRRALRRVQHLSFHTLELQQLAHINPDLTDLAYMNEKNSEYNAYKSSLQAMPDQVLSEWKLLGEENFDKLNKFLIAESEGGVHWFDLVKEGKKYTFAPNSQTAEKLAEFGLSEELGLLAMKAKQALLNQLQEMETSILRAVSNRYLNSPIEVLKAAITPYLYEVQKLRTAPFFPQGRFGNLMLIIEKKRLGEPGYEVVYREAFEDRAKWEEAVKKADANKKADENVKARELTDTQYVLMALPADFLELAASELGLTGAQVEQLQLILQPIKKEKLFRVQDQARLGIKGYSSDAMRSFANFTWHNANLIAKLRFRSEFNLAIRGVGSKLHEIEKVVPHDLKNIERLTRVKAYMERTRDYVMSPPNEAQGLRAFVSVVYLALNIKTALLNVYGLITTASDLLGRLGPVAGTKQFLKSNLEAIQSIKLTDLNARREGKYLEPEKAAALDRALAEGVLSQSYAYHLAGLANAGTLDRMYQRLPFGRTFQTFSQRTVDASMWPFRLMELLTRRVSFLAEFDAAKREKVDDPYVEAVTRTNKLQNDYSLGNRVPFMRGGAFNLGPTMPLATIFMSFAQHMAFHTYGGYELGNRREARVSGESPQSVWLGYTMRIWLVTLLLAGYEGLPGAENLLDIVEVLWRKFGGKKPIRQHLREFVQSVDGDPVFWAHGLGHNIAGFDISRSVGFGRMVPGTDVLSHPKDKIAETVGTLALDMAGPAGGFIKFGLEATFSSKPPGEVFQKLPGGLGNIYSSYYWNQHGVRSPSGALVTHDLQTGKLRELTATELWGKAMGFNPTIVSENRSIMFDQWDRKMFWQNKREMMMEDVWRATWQKDKKGEADARKAIKEYNAAIPAEYKDLRVTGADIAKSMQARRRTVAKEEQNEPVQKRYRSLYKDVKESYDRP